MIALLDLPEEMLREVWGFILPPQDVLNFASTSKAVCRLGKDARMEHHRLKKTHQEYCISSSGDNPSAALLLQQILKDPRIALYIEKLDIKGWKAIRDESIKPGTDSSAYNTEDFQLFTNAVHSSKLIQPAEMNGWIADIASGGEEPILALIVERLPNLKTFKMHHGESSGDRLFSTVQRFAQQQGPGALSGLTTVHLRGDVNTLGPFGTHLTGFSCVDHKWLRWLEAFAILPSVRELECRRIGCGDLDGIIQNTAMFSERSNIASSITSLLLEDCSIYSSWLYNFLGMFKALESFHCHNRNLIELSNVPHNIIETLRKTAGKTLRKLYLGLRTTATCSSADFAGFQVLNQMTVNLHFLLSTTLSPDIRNLKDRLPSSARELRIVCPSVSDMTWLQCLIEAVARERLQELPNLEKIDFELSWSWPRIPHGGELEKLMSRAQELGTPLEISNNPVMIWRGI